MFTASVKDMRLTLSRLDDNTTLFQESTENIDESFNTYGVFGLIEFNLQKYLVFITRADERGRVDNSIVYEVKQAKVIIIQPNHKIKNSKLIKKTIEQFFTSPGLYFSDYQLYYRYQFDKTEHKAKPEAKDLKTLFLFNKKPIDSFIFNFDSFNVQDVLLLKCIQGYFMSFNDFVLISRRCPKRIGARYFSRGIGEQGFPSNFVETEQIIINKSSYLQIRGSIPLKWSHRVNFKYHPQLKISPSEKQHLIASKNIEKIYKIPIIYLNLIRSSGYESEIFKSYNTQFKNKTKLFFNYDFKKELNKREYPFDFKRTGFTSKTKNQAEMIRTNCIDCLDRTNSMQYLIGEAIFDLQLEDSNIKDIKNYLMAFKKGFYENGNNISLQYAGTNAMSSYYITDGKKKTSGVLKDFLYSINRYFINRFSDGKHHTTLNLVTGNLKKGDIEFSRFLVSFNQLYSLKLLFIIPLFFVVMKNSNYPFKILILVISIIYVLILLFPIDFPKYDFLDTPEETMFLN